MKNSIKIWPDLNDLSSALVPYSDKKLSLEHSIHIDMSNILKINSSGAALTLNKLIKLITKNQNSRWSLEQSSDPIIIDFLNIVGFNNLLFNRIINKDLLWPIVEQKENTVYQQITKQNYTINSFPIYYLDYKKNNYRITVEEYNDWLIDNLSNYTFNYSLPLNILAKLLKEIAKNSEDHTNDNAFFGMDIIINNDSGRAELLFSFCDLGIGIHENIKKNIQFDSRFRENAAKKLGIVDSYHYAFTPGFTTSKSTKNKGIGMSMILDCAKLLNLELSVFDARSRGFIPKQNTHSEIRRNFWNTGNPVGFYYYGKMNLERNI